MSRPLPPELAALAGQVKERTLANGLKLYAVPRPGVSHELMPLSDRRYGP